MSNSSTSSTSAPDVQPKAPSGSGLALDALILAGLLVTAYFLASVPSRSGDVFGHLAAGRDLDFGRTWLFDQVVFWMERIAGLAALVHLKAAALTAFVGMTAWGARRAGATRREAIYCALPATLAVAPFSSVTPAAFTPLFFSSLLVLLMPEAHRGASPPRRAWLVVPLVAFWAGAAEYAVLGPVTVCCFALAAKGRTGRQWWLVAAAAPLAAFLNPDPLGVLRVPGVSLAAIPDVFRGDGWAAVSSPLSANFWTAATGYGPVGVALVLSILVPVIAIVVRATSIPLSLVLIWGVTLLAALAHWWAIPLLTCAGGVVVGAAWADRGGRALRSRRSAIAAGVLTATWALAMPAVAWPGWLQPPPYGIRQWRVEPEPSLRAAADWLGEQSTAGVWHGNPRPFVFAPETGDHLRWFCPAQRPTLTSETVRGPAGAEHDALVRAFSDPGVTWGEDGRAALRRLGTTHLVLFHPDAGRFARALTNLLDRPSEFSPLWWRGRVMIFGWRDPSRADSRDPFPTASFDLTPNASTPEWRLPAPDAGPVELARGWTWRDAFTRARAPRTADRDEANVTLLVFEHQRGKRGLIPTNFEAQQLAGLVAAAAGPGGPGEIASRIQVALAVMATDRQSGRPATPMAALGLAYRREVQLMSTDGPVGTLLRGVRCARRAVAANPDDAAAYQAMGEAYLRLRRTTRERVWCNTLPTLGRIRAAQTAFACRQALGANSELVAPHATLADLFGELGFVDAALPHVRDLIRLRRAKGAGDGETAEQFDARLQYLELEAGRLEEAVNQAEDRLAGFRSPRPADRASFALSNGLAERAIQILLDSDVAAFGTTGVLLELNLLLGLGRANEAREWLTPDHRATLGPSSYHAMRGQAAAACGDYRLAQEELTELRKLHAGDGAPPEVAVSQRVGLLVAEGLVTDAVPISKIFRQINEIVWREQILLAAAAMRTQCDLDAQMAWMLLEQGNYAEADRLAARALDAAGPMEFAAKQLARELREIIRGGN